MIELTPQQRQAVEQGEPVRVVDQTTQGAYVLMRTEVFERMAGAPQPPPAEAGAPPVSPAMLRAQRAFWRDLPDLLKERRNRLKWVAYHGDDRVGLGKTRTELYHRCLGRGLRPGEFYIGRVRERPTPPWEPTELEQSLYEFTDDPSFPPPIS
jgi:hypothetical protein